MNQRLLTPRTLIAVIFLSLGMWIAASIVPHTLSAENFGLCLSSPNHWVQPGAWSATLNLMSIIIICVSVFLLNKRYNFLRSGQPLWSFFTLPILCSMMPVSGGFNSMAIVTFGLLIICTSLFESYKSRNATRNIFFAATWIGIGSMLQYSFILFLPAMILSMFAVDVARFKEFIALLMGLLAPYWIVIGLGLLPLSNFNLPEITPIFQYSLPPRLFPFALACGISFFFGIILSLYNGLKLYAGNSKIRNFNYVINFFGLTAGIGLIIDTSNFRAYCGIFAIWIAIQFGNLFTLGQFRRPRILYWLIFSLIILSAVGQSAYLF